MVDCKCTVVDTVVLGPLIDVNTNGDPSINPSSKYILGLQNLSFVNNNEYNDSKTSPKLYSAIEDIIPDEQRLYEILMEGYEKSVRPVYNSTTIVTVKFGLHLNQIIGLVCILLCSICFK